VFLLWLHQYIMNWGATGGGGGDFGGTLGAGCSRMKGDSVDNRGAILACNDWAVSNLNFGSGDRLFSRVPRFLGERWWLQQESFRKYDHRRIGLVTLLTLVVMRREDRRGRRG